MRHSAVVWAVVMLAAMAGTAAFAADGVAADVYVAPQGNDAAAGTLSQPLATLARAVEVSRSSRTGSPRRIILRGGTYYNVSVELKGEDSGLAIEAAAGEVPMLYGGVPLKNWQKEGDRFYAAKLPEGRIWDVRLLVVNGRMCPRARYPEKGTLTHLSSFDVPWMSTTGGGWKRKPTQEELTTLNYKAGDLGAWLEVNNAEITIHHMWDESMVGVTANDTERHILRLAPEAGHPAGAFGVRKYVVWNIREGMTAPGQWYFDRPQRRIVYWPMPGEEMSSAEVIVPTAASIIRLSGSKDSPVRNVTLRGLTLSVTTVPLITGGFAAAAFDGGVALRHAESCRLENLVIRHVAGHAIKAGHECVATRVEGSDIGPCGAGGIYVGGTRTVISNNRVNGVGRAYPSAVGIYGGGRGNLVSHNEVHDCTYSAINYGGEGNIVEDNIIYDCMKVLHDGAGIYMFGARNCILRRNFAHDITDLGGYGASAYYLDEQSEGSIVERNLSVNVGWPSHNHMARKNTIRDNVFIVNGDLKLTFPRCADYSVQRNVIYATGKIRIEGIDAVANWSKNLFYSGSGTIEGIQLRDYSSSGTVNGARGDTLVADPLFKDLAKGDYRYQAGSPALQLGLEPVDVRSAGPAKH